MPGISVIDGDGDIQEFAEATTWHIDDRGQLHLKKGSEPVASFAKDRWQGAGTSESGQLAATAQAAALAEHTEALAEIHSALREIRQLMSPAIVRDNW